MHTTRSVRSLARSIPALQCRHYTESSLARPVQSYISTSTDPYLNLSIEHHLLQRSSKDSTILLFYTNRPSVIIGRNQNPWSEVNHAFIRRHDGSDPDPAHALDLVRRRSGGGTVFHDPRNVNWSVICPAADFTRDKHAEMVVRALRSLGSDRARVNERHDIVLDQGRAKHPVDARDTHITAYTPGNPARNAALKVSGSAYKLTRGRALHHGTALLDSANLKMIPHILTSPARDWIKSRGVESVPSPVGNLGFGSAEFIGAVREEFGRLYEHVAHEDVGDSWLACENVRKGHDELRSPEWTYLQTPQFTISNRDQDVDLTMPGLKLTVRGGCITETQIKLEGVSTDRVSAFAESLQGLAVHDITDWAALFEKADMPGGAAFAHWLESGLLGAHQQ